MTAERERAKLFTDRTNGRLGRFFPRALWVISQENWLVEVARNLPSSLDFAFALWQGNGMNGSSAQPLVCSTGQQCINMHIFISLRMGLKGDTPVFAALPDTP
jgi:hypothetical protein